MKRASYRHGVEWIALNDGVGDTENMTFAAACREVENMISTSLLADLFGKDPLDVARDIMRFRIRYEVGV